MPKLSDILGTKDRKEQEQIAASLKRAAQVPVIDLVIRYDPRNGLVDLVIVGADAIPFKVLYDILDDVRAIVREREHQALNQCGPEKQLPPPGIEGSVNPPTEQ